MSKEPQHIENWLQHSAKQAPIAVNEVHWLAMKAILEKKRKRRIFLWFFICINLLCFGLKLQLNNKKTSRNTVNSTSRISLQKNIVENKIIDTTSILKNNKQNKQLHHTTISNNTKNKVALKTKTPNYQYVKKIVLTPLLLSNKNKNETLQYTPKNNSIKSKSVRTFLKSNTEVDTDNKNSKNNNSTIKINHDLLKAENKKIDAQQLTSINNNKITIKPETSIIQDTLATVLKPNKIKNTNTTPFKKSFFKTEIGFVFGNVPIKSNGFHVSASYNKHLFKNIFIQAEINAAFLNAYEQQQHVQIKSITPILGTTAFLVSTSTSKIQIQQAYLLNPAFGVHYQKNKWQIGTSFSIGNLFNTSQQTKKIDTINFYNTRPNLTITSPLQENSFAGNRFTSLRFDVGYKISKKNTIALQHQILLNSNTLDGIIIENKKRSNWLLKFGIIF